MKSCEVRMEKDDRILDLAIHYALNNNYPETEELTKYQKRAVRKRAATLLGEKGEVYLEKRESEGDQLCSGTAANLEGMPFRSNLQTLWCHQDTQTDPAERFYWKGIVADVRKLVSS